MTWRVTGLLAALLLGSPLAHSQSSCSSDGQPAPTALLERFINANCESCWVDPATPIAAPGVLAMDWIVPGSQGEDAALAPAANSDALMRLTELNHAPPKTQSSQITTVSGLPGATLRVAHGPAVSGYLGASIELTLPPGVQVATPLQAWLVMVETLPQAYENSPVPRNLARNVLQPSWKMRDPLQNTEQINYKELRPMNIPQGARPERLRVVGWVQDAVGRVLLAAESTCPPEDKQ
ncbi:MAG: hypothetical protein PHQ58_08375 [Rhodoferax sp.]|uniref:hypothetical protein n=1 Tax=Rhodoferax sp. TaxID=50421 RepID=UPI00262F1D83|nr:hypothetical protein [Rhodoferax sp.]MDD2880441.1 hypothetical protein [Rhodoferax sp.]